MGEGRCGGDSTCCNCTRLGASAATVCKHVISFTPHYPQQVRSNGQWEWGNCSVGEGRLCSECAWWHKVLRLVSLWSCGETVSQLQYQHILCGLAARAVEQFMLLYVWFVASVNGRSHPTQTRADRCEFSLRWSYNAIIMAY